MEVNVVPADDFVMGQIQFMQFENVHPTNVATVIIGLMFVDGVYSLLVFYDDG